MTDTEDTNDQWCISNLFTVGNVTVVDVNCSLDGPHEIGMTLSNLQTYIARLPDIKYPCDLNVRLKISSHGQTKKSGSQKNEADRE